MFKKCFCILIKISALCRYACPVCSKSFCDMSRVWEKLDEQVTTFMGSKSSDLNDHGLQLCYSYVIIVIRRAFSFMQ